jgi:hypothetical protein
MLKKLPCVKKEYASEIFSIAQLVFVKGRNSQLEVDFSIHSREEVVWYSFLIQRVPTFGPIPLKWFYLISDSLEALIFVDGLVAITKS